MRESAKVMKDGKFISHATLKKRIGAYTKGRWVGAGRAKYAGFGDPKYYLATYSEIKSFLDIQKFPGFKQNAFDCEDFAFSCKAYTCHFQQIDGNIPGSTPLCLGIAWGRFRWIGNGTLDHACCWYIDSEKKLFWYEPQSNEHFEVNRVMNSSLTLMLA